MSETPHIYLNEPQYREMLIDAHDATHVWGRGTGKTRGLIAPRVDRCVFSMPRSCGAFVGATFKQMLTKTLNEMDESLQALGYYRDRDYVFGHYAPRKWKWPRPIAGPAKPDFLIHWRNGSVITLISQDRPGSANGLNLDWLIGDEAKFLRKDRFEQEVLPAMRGKRQHFISSHLHHSKMLVTDMPTSRAARWILEREAVANQPIFKERVELILATQLRVYELQKNLREDPNQRGANFWISEINKYKKALHVLRRGDFDRGIEPLVHFSRASSYENRHVLGGEFFASMKRILSDTAYQASIENKELTQLSNGFYPDLDEERHGYDRFDYSGISDMLTAAPEGSRFDGDIVHDQPLDIALDYGASFNCLVVGQQFKGEYRLVKSFHVSHPQKVQDVVEKFKSYYAHHKEKFVRFFYDHTSVGRHGATDLRYHQVVIDQLSASDEYGSWVVDTKYLGQTLSYAQRYELWSRILKERDPDLPRFRYNRINADSWAQSAMLAPVKDGRRGVEKDKSSETPERDGTHTDQDRATHLSDAGDTLLYGALLDGAPEDSMSGGGGAFFS